MKLIELAGNIQEKLLDNVKFHEGGVHYQQKTGSFKNNRFYTYKDSLGLDTIGYGHLVRPGESFPDGMTVDAANQLLKRDLDVAVSDANSWIVLSGKPTEVQLILIEMVYQLGKGRACGFKKFAAAIEGRDYLAAAQELLASTWHKQTPNRVEEYASVLKSLPHG
jgi:GH24 family phage-related lysozyme (muramidase)